MSEKVNINGVVQDASEARIPVMDHGFLFGDSVYETLRSYSGRFFRFHDHIERLKASASALHLVLPLDEEGFLERCEATLAAANEAEASVRIVVTRGTGPMELDPAGCLEPNVVVFVRPRPRYPDGSYEHGLSLAFVSRARNSARSLDPAVKSGNYLNNILALVEARKVGAYEGLMLNADGQVAEGTTSNVFIVTDGVVKTPPLSAGLLGGITRREVLALARAEDVPVEETHLCADEVRGADEVFITSSLKQLMPIGRIDDRPIGPEAGGGAGPITLQLLAAYRRAVKKETGVAPSEDS